MFGNLNDPVMMTVTGLVMAAITLAIYLTIFGEEGRDFPQHREPAVTTAITVIVMVTITAAFFLIADQIMRRVVTFLLGIGA